MTMNTSRRGFMKTLSALAAVATTGATLAHAADADLTAKVVRIVNASYPQAAAYPEVIQAFAEALQKPDSPRLESLAFVTSEGAQDSEAFARYVSIEFSVATNVMELDANRKLELLWK